MKKELFSLTNPQKSILLTEEFYKGCNINNICGTAIVDEKLNFELLKKAMSIFVKSHDSFSMKLIVEDEIVKQYLDDTNDKNIDIDFEIIDISSKADISKLEQDMLSHVFDIYNRKLILYEDF